MTDDQMREVLKSHQCRLELWRRARVWVVKRATGEIVTKARNAREAARKAVRVLVIADARAAGEKW